MSRFSPRQARTATLEREADRAGARARPLSRAARHVSGEPLGPKERRAFESQLGHDFSEVRIHDDSRAAASARAENALAFTLDQDVHFAEGRYAPETAEGARLLAHELAHVVQQREGRSSRTVQRTAASCPSGWATTVASDHTRALGMIDTAQVKLAAYNGTTPPKVKPALDKHFKASSTAFAGWVNFNLGILRLLAPLADYDCEDTSSWWCSGTTQAKTFWCVPGIDIRVCQPRYFSEPPLSRSEILIHEWVHKYGCNFDLGYKHEADYPSQWTITALLNADPFSEFVKDVQ
jgi:hypothetical protein